MIRWDGSKNAKSVLDYTELHNKGLRKRLFDTKDHCMKDTKAQACIRNPHARMVGAF